MPRQLSRGLSDGGQLRIGDLLDALNNDQRRTVLRLLVASDGAVGVRELAREIAAPADETTPDVDNVVIALHHNHLPRLDDIGIVTYDPEANVVEADDSIAALTPYLEFLAAKRQQ